MIELLGTILHEKMNNAAQFDLHVNLAYLGIQVMFIIIIIIIIIN